MNKKSDLTLQLAANLIPLIGFWFLNWNMFAIVYLYWSEGFIVALFNSTKIAIAKGDEADGVKATPFSKRLISSIKFFVFRLGILLFYWIFIFAFVAFPGGAIYREMAMQNFKIMWFMDSIFNNALLVYFLSQMMLFFSAFIASGDFRNKPSSDYKILFDGRTIVLHIVIVLGTFGYQFLEQFQNISQKLPGLSYVLLLVLIKSIADFIQYKNRGSLLLKK